MCSPVHETNKSVPQVYVCFVVKYTVLNKKQEIFGSNKLKEILKCINWALLRNALNLYLRYGTL